MAWQWRNDWIWSFYNNENESNEKVSSEVNRLAGPSHFDAFNTANLLIEYIKCNETCESSFLIELQRISMRILHAKIIN